MLEEQKNKLKAMFSLKPGENNKRKIENLVVFVIILIVTIIIINTVWNSDKKKQGNLQNTTDKILAQKEVQQTQVSQTNTNELEEKLKNILQKIQGVGEVEVLLTYSQSSQTMAMYNEDKTQSDTEETDTRTEETEKYQKAPTKRKSFTKKLMEKRCL